jgi:outer membrane protein assembly factor BamA
MTLSIASFLQSRPSGARSDRIPPLLLRALFRSVPLILLGSVLLVPPAAVAQLTAEEAGGRLIEEVSFSGTDAISESSLKTSIFTEPTRCRGLLLTPFCWVIDSDVLIERHRLDPGELARDELRVLVRYFREGYREAAAAAEIEERGGGVRVRFEVVEGAPTLIESIEVTQQEQVLRSRDLDGADLPAEGEPLSHRRLEAGIERLAVLLREAGYLDHEIRDSIEVSERSARVDVAIDPGPRSTVAGFDIQGNEEIEDETIIRALFLAEGELLTTPLLARSRRALHRSNLFHEADVAVVESADSAKMVEVRVREAPPRLGRVGGGFNTLEFVQVEGRYTHYNWRGAGRRMDLRTGVGNLLAPQLTDRLFFRDILPGELSDVDEGPFKRPTWQASVEFAQPAFRAAENTLGLSLFAHRRVVPAVSVDQGYGAEVSLTRTLGFQMPLSLSYRHEVISVRAGDVYFCVTFGICEPTAIASLRERNTLAPLSLSYLVDRSDAALAPTTGYRGRVSLEHASGATLSDFRYNRASADLSYYQPFGGTPRHVVAGHVRAGWVRSLDSTKEALGTGGTDETGQSLLHPRKRFFSGGARSVRGYAENQLGPRVLTIPRALLLGEDLCTEEEIHDRSCDPSGAPLDAFASRPLGGTSVLEGSVEYRFPIRAIYGAVFVDAAMVGGRVEGFLQDAARSVTPGFGVRVPSPAGPIRIDLGVRGSEARLLPVITESETDIGNGVIERELVQLDQRRLFDPLEDQGTLGQILGRLTLHFSIGEAF